MAIKSIGKDKARRWGIDCGFGDNRYLIIESPLGAKITRTQAYREAIQLGFTPEMMFKLR